MSTPVFLTTLRSITALLAAALVTALVASIVQSQIVLSHLLELGAPVTASVRAWTTLADLAGFGPVMIAIALA
ncbi:MAG: hypothetical protein ABW202_14295, partial [Duganella sp.]